jgi:hypothetical protein
LAAATWRSREPCVNTRRPEWPEQLIRATWKYVMVRRPFVFVKSTIDQGLQWVVSEANGEPST